MRYIKRVENWQTRNGPLTKITVRASNGTFHGATNFAEAR